MMNLHLFASEGIYLSVAHVAGDTYALSVSLLPGEDPIAIIFGTSAQIADVADETIGVAYDVFNDKLERLALETWEGVEYFDEPTDADPWVDYYADMFNDPDMADLHAMSDDDDGRHGSAFWTW